MELNPARPTHTSPPPTYSFPARPPCLLARPLYPQLLAAFNCSDEMRNTSISELPGCRGNVIWAALYCFNYAISPAVLAGFIDKALVRVLHKQGRVDDAQRLLEAVAEHDMAATTAEPTGNGFETIQSIEAELHKFAAPAASKPGTVWGGSSGIQLLLLCCGLALGLQLAWALHQKRKLRPLPQPLPK